MIVRPSEEGGRIPLSVSDWDADKGTVTLIFMEVGDTTRRARPLWKAG